jgi:hypothetical protein
VLSIWIWEFFSHEHLVANSFHAPMWDWVEGGRTQCFTAAQAEAGVVLGASHSVPNDEPLRQRCVVMSAVCTNREKIVAIPDQDGILAFYLPQGHCSIGKISNQESLPEIVFRSFRLCHIFLGLHHRRSIWKEDAWLLQQNDLCLCPG